MIEQWLRKDCAAPVEEIIAMMQRYILQPQGKVF